MSSLLPSFNYPADASTGYSYYYNYNDVVNVSWSWNGPPEASVFVLLWLSKSSPLYLLMLLLWPSIPTIHCSLLSFGPKIGSNQSVFAAGNASYLSLLNFTGLQYPGSGHFNLWAHFENGTVIPGPNSAEGFVGKNEEASSECHNCLSEASGSASSMSSGSVVSTSPTGVTTSNNAATSVVTSETPISSPQPMPPGGGLSGGAIPGIVVGVIVAVVIARVLGVFCWRRRTGGRKSHKMAPIEGLNTLIRKKSLMEHHCLNCAIRLDRQRKTQVISC